MGSINKKLSLKTEKDKYVKQKSYLTTLRLSFIFSALLEMLQKRPQGPRLPCKEDVGEKGCGNGGGRKRGGGRGGGRGWGGVKEGGEG